MDAKAKLAALLKNKQVLLGTSKFDGVLTLIKEKFQSTLNTAHVKGKTLSWLVVTPNITQGDEESPCSVQLQICSDNTYKFKILGITKSEGKFDDPIHTDFELRCLLEQLSNSSYKICPGIENYETDYYDIIRFHAKGVRQWIPSPRVAMS